MCENCAVVDPARSVVFAVLGLGLIGGWNLIPAFIGAFQRYFDGFYILLNLPIP